MSLKKQRLIYYLIVDAAIMTLFFKNYFVPDHLSLNRFLLF